MALRYPELYRVAMQSPCVKLCEYDPGFGLCRGCGRTLDEIAAWTMMDEAARRQVMAELPARLAALKASRDRAPDRH